MMSYRHWEHFPPKQEKTTSIAPSQVSSFPSFLKTGNNFVVKIQRSHIKLEFNHTWQMRPFLLNWNQWSLVNISLGVVSDINLLLLTDNLIIHPKRSHSLICKTSRATRSPLPTLFLLNFLTFRSGWFFRRQGHCILEIIYNIRVFLRTSAHESFSYKCFLLLVSSPICNARFILFSTHFLDLVPFIASHTGLTCGIIAPLVYF